MKYAILKELVHSDSLLKLQWIRIIQPDLKCSQMKELSWRRPISIHYRLLHLTVGRQEKREDSPTSWPQRDQKAGSVYASMDVPSPGELASRKPCHTDISSKAIVQA